MSSVRTPSCLVGPGFRRKGAWLSSRYTVNWPLDMRRGSAEPTCSSGGFYPVPKLRVKDSGWIGIRPGVVDDQRGHRFPETLETGRREDNKKPRRPGTGVVERVPGAPPHEQELVGAEMACLILDGGLELSLEEDDPSSSRSCRCSGGPSAGGGAWPIRRRSSCHRWRRRGRV